MLDSHSGIENTKTIFQDLIQNKTIHKYNAIYNSQNSFGNYINNSRNIKQSFDVENGDNIAYSNRMLDSKDCFDNSGVAFGELIYESMASTQNTFRNLFSYIVPDGSNNCEYSLICKNCSFCFGCVGLTNANYCILNKQYTKEEYFKITEKIKDHMMQIPYVDKNGRVFKYGEFLPYDMSPFGYNETNAHDFFPTNRESALLQGFNWTEREDRDYKITIKSEDLPNKIEDVSDSILEEVISCPNNGKSEYQCTTAFKIIPDELLFYKKKSLPLPGFCPNCRNYQRLKYKNPFKLWHRKCMKDGCHNEFETSYAPERPEIVYCESCYNREVY